MADVNFDLVFCMKEPTRTYSKRSTALIVSYFHDCLKPTLFVPVTEHFLKYNFYILGSDFL